ncbi:rhomboid protease GluP [Chitinophaga dinghuensis]|uniref:Rhomboid protease GluP n=1 Tax=Chitinophaga dinghuensis TaxID=1539050 RepID=A0A327VJC7_9BACT|nr:rhomboid family intramembrane serine protease [Chitinophaga dinghuensis]RAJ73964.1 rhomboid protease GluP [Chitinophaga dinghuensis]
MQIQKHLLQMPVTLALIAINCIVFFVMVFSGLNIWSGNPDTLLHAGGNYWPYTIDLHQYWRLLTSMFLHGGLWHLFTNMLGLFMAGLFLEPVIRGPRMCLVYFCTGIMSDFASIWFHKDTLSVGASGGIFGIYGAFLALLTTTVYRPTIRKPLLAFIALFVGLNIILAFFSGGIDNIAHLTGFCIGILLGYILYFTLSNTAGNQLPDETK